MMEKVVSFSDLKILKENNLVFDNEVVYATGDILIAENISSKERRIINVQGKNLMLECRQKILKG